MHKTTLRTNQPGAGLHQPKAETQKKAMSSIRQTESSKGRGSAVKKGTRAAPEIRHTLASKLRLVKSNPLLEVSGAITLPPNVKKPRIVSTLKENVPPLAIRSVDDTKSLKPVQPKQDKNIKNWSCKTAQQKMEPEKIKPNNALQPKLNNQSKPLNTLQQRKDITRNKLQTAVQKPSSVQQTKRPLNLKTSFVTKNESQVRDNKLQLKRTVTFVNLPRKSSVNVRRSRSASDLPSPIREDDEDGVRKVYVKTPVPSTSRSHSSAQRQPLHRSNSWRQSMYAPMPRKLRENLERWLQKHGKPVTSFHHLHCFGVKASDITNPLSYSKAEESDLLNTTFTTDDANISQAAAGNDAEGEDRENIEDAKSVVENTLKDLLDLINLGYPRDRCEDWLQLIQKHFYNVREEPTYWECRAALEESSHDLQAAINCYEQAIIKGAMPEEISKSLDGLMKKFNFLHLDPEENKLNSTTKPAYKHILDARNVFKSSIIKFALLQRKNKRPTTPGDMKATSSQYVATPVRRSARISSSGYRSTPKMMCVSSLNQLDDDIRKTLVFETNSALEP